MSSHKECPRLSPIQINFLSNSSKDKDPCRHKTEPAIMSRTSNDLMLSFVPPYGSDLVPTRFPPLDLVLAKKNFQYWNSSRCNFFVPIFNFSWTLRASKWSRSYFKWCFCGSLGISSEQRSDRWQVYLEAAAKRREKTHNTEYKNEIIKKLSKSVSLGLHMKRRKNYIFIVARNVISLVKKTQWTERDIGSCFCCDLCIASEEERTNSCDKTRLGLSVDWAVKKQPRHSLKANNQVVSRLWNFCNLCPCEGVEIAKLTENLFLDISPDIRLCAFRL